MFCVRSFCSWFNILFFFDTTCLLQRLVRYTHAQNTRRRKKRPESLDGLCMHWLFREWVWELGLIFTLETFLLFFLSSLFEIVFILVQKQRKSFQLLYYYYFVIAILCFQNRIVWYRWHNVEYHKSKESHVWKGISRHTVHHHWVRWYTKNSAKEKKQIKWKNTRTQYIKINNNQNYTKFKLNEWKGDEYNTTTRMPFFSFFCCSSFWYIFACNVL